MRILNPLGMIVLMLGLANAGNSFAATVAIPYINNFESYGTGSAVSDFTNGKSGSDTTVSWTVQTGSNGTNIYRGVITNGSAGSTKNTAVVNAGTNFSSLGGFTLSSDFNVLAGSTANGGYRIGFSALTQDSNPSNSNGGVWAFLNSNGTLGLQNLQSGASLNIISNNSTFGTLVLGGYYTASLTGEYSGGNLLLTYTITQTGNTLGSDSNIGKSATITASIAANAFAGTNFGYVLFDGPANWQGGNSLTVDMDNFNLTTLTIPEPSTYACLLLGIGILIWLSVRRQSARKTQIQHSDPALR